MRTRRTTSWKVWWVPFVLKPPDWSSAKPIGCLGGRLRLEDFGKANPSYLVIANDPEKEQVIGSLNALVLNRLITRVNSKGNIPVSVIVDELPTLYFRGIRPLDWYGPLQQGGGDPGIPGVAAAGGRLRQGGDAEDYHDLR